MIVRRFIEKLQEKGYDDFYWADLANRHGGFVMLVLFLLQAMIPILIAFFPQRWFGDAWLPVNLFGKFWICAMILTMGIPWAINETIKETKDEGETDLRMNYLFGSVANRLVLKVLRYAPLISALVLLVSLGVSLYTAGFHRISFTLFLVSASLLLLTARFYHKWLSRVGKEAMFYVDWTTDHDIEHFDELISRHERWRTPSVFLDFEKFNMNKFRCIRVAAVVGTFACLPASFIYVLGLTPYIGIEIEKHHRAKEYAVLSDATQQQQDVQSNDAESAETDEKVIEEPIDEVIDKVEGVVEDDENLSDVIPLDRDMFLCRIKTDPDLSTPDVTSIYAKPDLYNSKVVRELYGAPPVRCKAIPDNDAWYEAYDDENKFLGYVLKNKMEEL